MKTNINVICLEDEALYMLVEELVKRLKFDHGIGNKKWVSAEEAMELLNVKSRTSMQRYRDEGRIRFSKATKRNFLYDYESIQEYLVNKSEDIF